MARTLPPEARSMSSTCLRCRGQFIRDVHNEICCLQCGYSPPPPDLLDLLDLPENIKALRAYKKASVVDPRDFFQVAEH